MISVKRWWERLLLTKPSQTEKLILSAAIKSSPDQFRAALKYQVGAIAGVRREEDGGKIYFIYDNDYTEQWRTECLLNLEPTEVVFARVVLEYYRYIVTADVWIVKNVLFSIEYPGPAVPGAPNHLKVLSCDIFPTPADANA